MKVIFLIVVHLIKLFECFFLKDIIIVIITFLSCITTPEGLRWNTVTKCYLDIIYVVICHVISYSDQGLTQPAAINPLAEFSSYHHHHLRVSDKLSFRPLSVKECAQLCLQVTREQMFNCSSFEHVTDTSDCLLMAFSCQNNILSLDSSTDFYQLKG